MQFLWHFKAGLKPEFTHHIPDGPQRSERGCQKIQDRCRACCEGRLQEQLTVMIKDSCTDRMLVSVEPDVSKAIHLRLPCLRRFNLRTADDRRSVDYGKDHWAGAPLLYSVAPARL